MLNGLVIEREKELFMGEEREKKSLTNKGGRRHVQNGVVG